MISTHLDAATQARLMALAKMEASRLRNEAIQQFQDDALTALRRGAVAVARLGQQCLGAAVKRGGTLFRARFAHR